MTNININIDTDTLRHALNGDEEALKEVRTLLPTPRTLADMAPVERAECEWMQCDHHALEEPGVILQIWGNGCHVLSREGVVETEALNHVTPRPDLPRMEWPGNEPEDDVAAATGGELTTQDVVDECRAVRKERAAPESAAPPPEDVPPGEPWQVEVDGRVAIGFRSDPETALCWMVVYRDDDDHDYLFDRDVTLVARLVPETTEPDDVPVFDPAYTYSDKDEDVWNYYEPNRMWVCQDSRGWHIRADSVPPTRFGPYTRIEKENDHEHLADLHRVRTELEERIRIWLIVADKLEARGLAAEADVTRTHANELTRILNGDTNE